LQNSGQIVITNKSTPSFLQPFLLPNQQRQSIEGKDSLSVLTTIFQVKLGWPVFIEAKDDGGGGEN